jgi:RNase P subunit RPR2
MDEEEEKKPNVWYEHGIRHVVPDKRKLKNLKQNKGLTDEEFDDMYAKKYLSIEKSNEFEKKINEKLQEFEKEYDLTDMKVNDRTSLRALVQAVIALEDYEQLSFQLRTREEGIDADNIYVFDRVNKVMSDLREDINKLQTELKISRKSRKSDADSSFIDYLESVKARAKKFYEAKMHYMYCPKCKTLLGTIWTLYPEEPKNKIRLVCNREIDDNMKCDGEIVIGTKELLENKGHSEPNLVPIRME